ncbi:MAG: hypothetical protein HUU50_04190 [Candidatus Brocadiae bacterium]|nr:hypothetical protein [Candidatus Brocadiia bacterium]
MNCCCPLHQEQNPSFGFNTTTGAFKCFSCHKKGNLAHFEQYAHGGTYQDAITRLTERVHLTNLGNSLEARVERYHQYLLENKHNSLTTAIEMGISQEIIQKHKLGYMPQYGKNEERLIFPIYDESGNLLTIKKYSRKAPHKTKSKFEKGGKVSLYGIHQLNGNKEIPVVLCAGEKDKCVGESYLGERFLFVTFTGGEGSLPKEELWDKASQALQGRNITICYDADDQGIARSLSVVEWPKEFSETFPKGDTTDCIMLWDKGGSGVMAQILENAKEFSSEDITKNTKNGISLRQSSNIIEQDGQYIKILKEDNLVPISNFVIHPIERIWIDAKEAVKANLISSKGSYTVTIEKEAWHSRYNFLKEIASIDLSYTGNDVDLQNIQAIVASYDVPVHQGTRVVGYAEEQKAFVLPNQIISLLSTPDLVCIPEKGEHPFLSMFHTKWLEKSQVHSFLDALFQHLPNLHEPSSLGVFLGWLFASPFKPQIMKVIGHFPILNVYGTKGSGKSSLTLLLWRLFGFSSGEIFSCTQSPFTWLRLLSSTNAFPLFFDEFKPWDMNPQDVQRIHRLLRRIYTGEIESRGKPDQSLIHYQLHAPVGILGEVSFREPALLERILPVPLSFQLLNQKHRDAYKTISALPLEGFLPLYLSWILTANIQGLWREAIDKANQWMEDSCPDRIQDNIAVAIFGLSCLKKFATDRNCKLPLFDEKAMVKMCIRELCEDVSGGKLAVDVLLEKLAYMAECGILVHNRDYRIEPPDTIYLRLEPCLDKFKEWARKVSFEGEILDAKAYHQMFKERLHLYVLDLGKKVRISTGSYRVVVLDRKKAGDTGINIDGFFPG